MTAPGLLEVFTGLVEADPDRVVLHDAFAGRTPPRPTSRRQLRDLAADMAADLRELGLGPGDRLAVWLPNWSQAVAAQLAALSVGALVVGVNTRYNVDEVAHLLRAAEPRALVIADGFQGLDLLARFRSAVGAVPCAAPTALVVRAPGEEPIADPSPYDLGGGARAFPRCSGRTDLPARATPGLAAAFTTSGSTGLPKLAAHGELAVTEHALAAGRRMGLGPGDVVLGALPLSGVFGFNATMAALLCGAATVLEPVFDASGVLADMAACGVTHVAAGDDLVGRLADAWAAAPLGLSLRWIGLADFAGRAQDVAAWAETELGAMVTGVYGSSELFALLASWPEEVPTGLRWTGGGRVVMPSIEVRAADPADGRVLGDREDGELQFRGPTVVEAYLGDPAATTTAFTGDGWFRSGDLGRVIAPGTFQYVGRIGDVLRLRGFLVDPAEIELRLSRHPAVRQVKVVGAPDPRGGGTLAVAFVVPSGTELPAEAELRRWCAEGLAAFKVPARIQLIDAMPTTSGTNGTKIRTSVLREMAAAAGR